MAKAWTDIANHFGNLRESCEDMTRNAALASIESLVRHISMGPLASVLYGWSSMWDLCIQQVDISPYSGPYLRIGLQTDGMVEFRYFDTQIQSRQWSRRVPPEGVIGRFDAFLGQLRWTAE